MENAVEALKMAAAVMVFVIALTVSMYYLNSVKSVSDAILYSKDETNYYEYQGAIGKAQENRIVGLETIIPTLYKYYKENYTVVFKQGKYDTTTGEFTNWSYLTVYNTSSNSKLWGYSGAEDSNGNTSYDRLMLGKYGETTSRTIKKIFSFDLDEETLRHEPWTGSNSELKNNLDCFLQGSIYKNPNDNTSYIDYSKIPLVIGGFIGKYKNSKFVETVSEYTYESNQSTNSTLYDSDSNTSLVKNKTKRIITFTLIIE